jgi:hypothetical protein
MTPKRWITAILLLFVAGSLVVLGLKTYRRGAAPAPESAQPAVVAPTTAPSARVQEQQAQTTGKTVTAAPAALPGQASQQSAGSDVATGSNRLIVYYFHVNMRCRTCLSIENLTRTALEQGFGKELREGKIEWKPINVEKPENEHFIADFQLASRTVVLFEVKKGQPARWENLQQVWYLVGNEQEFIAYVQDAIRSHLRAL